MYSRPSRLNTGVDTAAAPYFEFVLDYKAFHFVDCKQFHRTIYAIIAVNV